MKVIFGICIVGVGILLTVFFHLFIPLSFNPASESVFITIPRKSSAQYVAHLLKESGIIRSERAFVWYAVLTSSTQRIRAGSFSLSPASSVANVLGHLTQQNGAAQYTKVTFPEGYDLRQMDAVLSDAGLTQRGEFYNYVTKQAKLDFMTEFPFLRSIPVRTLEGYLFPSTYYFTPAESLPMMVRMMLAAFEEKMLPLWEMSTSPLASQYTFHQVLTMASIVQKEARAMNEMPVISSVYYNRLNKKMRLEADPTVVYGLGLTKKDRVLYSDLLQDNPYNTYRRFGLPPTPIASPGVEAFVAALTPAQTPYLFFVANSDGTHVFTRTYKEHLQVQKHKNL